MLHHAISIYLKTTFASIATNHRSHIVMFNSTILSHNDVFLWCLCKTSVINQNIPCRLLWQSNVNRYPFNWLCTATDDGLCARCDRLNVPTSCTSSILQNLSSVSFPSTYFAYRKFSIIHKKYFIQHASQTAKNYAHAIPSALMFCIRVISSMLTSTLFGVYGDCCDFKHVRIVYYYHCPCRLLTIFHATQNSLGNDLTFNNDPMPGRGLNIKQH